MKKLIVFLLLLILLPFVSYAQIWEGGGGNGIDEGLGFGGGSSGGTIDWSDFDGDKCTVTFMDIDNTYSQSAVVPVGLPSSYILESLTVPTKTGYDFTGWSTLSNYPSLITMPVTFTATETYYTVYTPHMHNVTYMLDNNVYYVAQNVPYGTSTIPLPPEPEYPDIPQNNALYYWQNLPSTMPDNDVTVTAVYGIAYWTIDIDQTTGDVTYSDRAANMLPISVDGNTINNWSDNNNSWKTFVYNHFRPCMLKSNGTVDYYLDRDNQNYKDDGITASDISNTSYDGNAMVEIKKMYIKITEPSADVIRVQFADKKIDNNFTAHPFTKENGNEVDKVYHAMFSGSLVSNKMRSIVGGGVLNTNSSYPKDYWSLAVANGSGWNIGYYSLRNHINLLSVMVFKTPRVSTSGYNVSKATGIRLTSSTSSTLVGSGAFSRPTSVGSGNSLYKLFWIRDFFVSGQIANGIAFDVDNSCWKYRNTPPYTDYISSDYSTYQSCNVDGLDFKTSSTGVSSALVSKMAVKDNLLFVYQQTIVTSSNQSSPSVNPYGNSVLREQAGQNGSLPSGIWPSSFGPIDMTMYYVGGSYNNIWAIVLVDHDSMWETWTNNAFTATLTYMP